MTGSLFTSKVMEQSTESTDARSEHHNTETKTEKSQDTSDDQVSN